MERPLCSVCNKNVVAKYYNGPNHKLYRDKCDRCRRTPKSYLRKNNRLHREFIKEFCERCGFVPEHESQLDVDHIDGDKKNNDPSNLMTLCANCHRLKTHLSGDSRNRAYRGIIEAYNEE